ncbi:MAG: HAD hydrolase-like protein [Pseudomonadota bacterium]
MPGSAILFVGLGSVAEYAETDRAAWNAAFRAHGMRWEWSWESYAELMRPGGARDPAAHYAAFIGIETKTAELVATQVRNFAARMTGDVPLRQGVTDVLAWAARSGVTLGLISRAAPAAVHAVLGATARHRGGIAFDTVMTGADSTRLAPHPDAVEDALDRLKVAARDAVAIADTPASAAAALDAGLATLAYPSFLAEEQAFPAAAERLSGTLTADAVAALIDAAQQTAAE